ncbi:hypothetical protein Halru_2757 [Halovivax ruber XH-70]|uniref:Uncharacterized protein n=1 Tax=Halovivax ruber (strain DSM 18193 / JCM 13892 / XH-70) TaxID=797302 RepID=L0IH99_HALRX|nr:hypothetical protein [Halovivax ruber]AGB17332.1 hypothetical protein Halru_2757 [Halovivax ruber XH-70]
MLGTATGFVLGALIGSITTAVGSGILYWKRERDRTDRLRGALAAELRSYDYLDEMISDGQYEAVTERVEPPTVYASIGGNLGRLSDDEVTALVTFYADCRWLDGLEDPEDKKAEIELVVEHRQAALTAVER